MTQSQWCSVTLCLAMLAKETESGSQNCRSADCWQIQNDIIVFPDPLDRRTLKVSDDEVAGQKTPQDVILLMAPLVTTLLS